MPSIQDVGTLLLANSELLKIEVQKGLSQIQGLLQLKSFLDNLENELYSELEKLTDELAGILE